MHSVRATLGFLNVRNTVFVLCLAALAASQTTRGAAQAPQAQGVETGRDYKHDTSKKLTDIPPKPFPEKKEHEANRNPRRINLHKDEPEAVAQTSLAAPAMTILDDLHHQVLFCLS